MRRAGVVLNTGVTAGLIVLIVVLVGATAVGLTRRHRDGRLRESRGPRLSEAELGAGLGAAGTLVQFSSPFCAPCRATRQLLADVASSQDSVAHIEIDAAARMDLARRLAVRRTPTVFVLAPTGQIVGRVNGLPRRDEIVEALARAAAKPTQRIGIDRRHGHA